MALVISQPATPATDDQLLKAIEIIVSPVFGALSMAHELAGHQSAEWLILEQYTPRQIVDEIIERGLSLDGRLAACSRVTRARYAGDAHDPRLRPEAAVLAVLS
jgi:hypothetical protein